MILLFTPHTHTQLQALAKALWERAQPGRAAKAKLSRETFLKGDYGTDGEPAAVVQVEVPTDPPRLLDEDLRAERAAVVESELAEYTYALYQCDVLCVLCCAVLCCALRFVLSGCFDSVYCLSDLS